MSFVDCIIGKASKGLLTDKQSKEVTKLYDKLYYQYKRTMGDEGAANRAASEAQNILSQRLVDENQNNVKAILFQANTVKKLEKKFEQSKKSFESRTKLQQTFLRSPSYDRVVDEFLEETLDRTSSVKRQLFAPLNKFIEKQGSKFAGLVQDHKGMVDIVRELLGDTTGNADAKMFGSALRDMFDTANKMYREAGGIMGKIDNYFPQTHNSKQIGKVTYEQWRDFILPKLDIEKMVDLETGLPIDPANLDAAMRSNYESIVSNGLSDIKKRADAGKQTFGYGGDVAKKHDSSRFYHFKDAESFLSYNERFGFGSAGLFDAVIGHINVMSRDIGIMQKMGPKANGLMRHLDLQMQGRGVGKNRRNYTKGMYDVLSGRTSGDGQSSVWFQALEGVKDLLRATLLSQASVSALSDSTFVAMAANLNGLPVVKTANEYLSQINPANPVHRRDAAANGYIAEAALGHTYSHAKYSGDATGPQLTRALAGFTNRFSGLSHMTDAAKNALPMTLQKVLAEAKISKTGFFDMDPDFRNAMYARGIGEDEFNIWMKSELHSPRDEVFFLRPEEVAEINDPKALKAAMALDDWQSRMRHQSANEPGLFSRSLTTGAFVGNADTGSINRAFWSSFFMFKGFGVNVMINHLIPAVEQAAVGRFGSLAGLAIGMTVMGTFVVQVKQLLAGRDTIDSTNPKLWVAGAAQGGGFGLLGDYLFQDFSRFGKDLTTTLAGPVAGLASDVFNLVKGNSDALLNGSDTNFGREAVKFVTRNAPIHSLYTELILNRTIVDSLERMVDPKFDTRARALERRQKSNFGNESWWKKGDTSPYRAPNIIGK